MRGGGLQARENSPVESFQPRTPRHTCRGWGVKFNIIGQDEMILKMPFTNHLDIKYCELLVSRFRHVMTNR